MSSKPKKVDVWLKSLISIFYLFLIIIYYYFFNLILFNYEIKSSKVQLSPQEISIIKKVFNRIDLDGNGVIQISELAASMKEIVPDVTDEEVQEIFASTDKDKNGTIEFNEFLVIFSDWLNSWCIIIFFCCFIDCAFNISISIYFCFINII